MKTKRFNDIIESQIDLCKDMLIRKSDEYSSAKDKLHNFKVASELQDCSVRKALAGMMSKHTVSVYDMCVSDELNPSSMWDEKITDHINYLLLLKAVVIEELDELSCDLKKEDVSNE